EPNREPAGGLEEYGKDRAGHRLRLLSQQRRRGHQRETQRRGAEAAPDRPSPFAPQSVSVFPEVLTQALPDEYLVVEVARRRGEQQPQLRNLVVAVAHRAPRLRQEILGQRTLAVGTWIEVREDVVVVV